LIPFDFDSVPKVVRKADPPKKKEKKNADVEKAAGAEKVPQEVPQGAAPLEKKERKEGKKNDAVKEPAKKKAAGGGKSAAVDDGEPRPSMIDLRVGHIVDGECCPTLVDLFAHIN
jgi:aminoacyl tRNA synthase complex-interacting multifunctional protein 1